MIDINGNNNVVGAGNTVTYGQPDQRPPPHHPNATTCPQCLGFTWVASDYCACGYNLAAARYAKYQRAQARAQWRRQALFSGLAFLGAGAFLGIESRQLGALEHEMCALAIGLGVTGLALVGFYLYTRGKQWVGTTRTGSGSY